MREAIKNTYYQQQVLFLQKLETALEKIHYSMAQALQDCITKKIPEGYFHI